MKFALTREQFKQELDRQVKRQYRLVDISTCIVNGRAQLAGIWEKGAEFPWHAVAGYTPMEFQAEASSRSKQGFRLIHLGATSAVGRITYDAIWEKHQRPSPEVRLSLTADEFLESHETLTGSGHQLLRIAAFEKEGAVHFAGLWEERDKPSREVQLKLSYTQLRREFRDKAKVGVRLAQVCAYAEKRRLRHACIWEEAEGPKQQITGGLTAVALAKTLEKMASDRFGPLQISAYTFGGRDRYVVVWEEVGDAD